MDMNKLGLALQGMGAGFTGQGAQWRQEQAQANAMQDAERRRAMYEDAFRVKAQIEGNRPDLAIQTATQRIEAINQLGGDPSDTVGLLSQMQNGDFEGALGEINTLLNTAAAFGEISLPGKSGANDTAKIRDYEYFNNLTEEQQDVWRTLDKNLTAEEKLALARGQQQIQDESTQAAELRKIKQEQEAKTATMDKAYNAYTVGIDSFQEAAGLPITGSFVGMLPALTSDSRTFEGAVDIMFPLLKDIFRGAGEGVFTDADAKAIKDMLPTRKDDEATKAFKLQMLDNVVRLKTNQPLSSTLNNNEPSASGFKIIGVKP